MRRIEECIDWVLCFKRTADRAYICVLMDPVCGISHADPLLNHESVAREHEEWQKCPQGISHRGSLVVDAGNSPHGT